MALFAIADVHLSLGSDKPMDVFGPAWHNHVERLAAAWRATVADTDTVLVPGDISWAMNFTGLLPDLQFLDALPGEKILSRGNHDYWWSTLTRMEAMVASAGLTTIRFLKNNAFRRGNDLITGSRGWLLPWDLEFSSRDEKILSRECGRLRLSLDCARANARPADNTDQPLRLVTMLHYPPTDNRFRPSPYTEVLASYAVDVCVYGHLHGAGARVGPAGVGPCGVRYVNASADLLQFVPRPI